MNMILSVSRNQKKAVEKLAMQFPHQVELIKRKNVGGPPEFIQAFVALSALNLSLIAKILIEEIRAKSRVSLKIGELELIGYDIDPATVEELLRKQISVGVDVD